ncbi:hypothetical protein ACFYTQ_05815 [Nocardia sp. NPDC004068]|uniref:hypothetical protein n=1 Tax=Nocardia sp. NPDC004068 TaxID=3364303 RepID=UPI0036754339
METFTEAHLLRRSRGGADNRARARLERRRHPNLPRPYQLRGLIRHDCCERKMQAEMLHGSIYYRCLARSLAPGSPAAADHPKTVNLREAHLLGPLNTWLATLFDRQHRADTIAALVAAQDTDDSDLRRQGLHARIRDADTKLDRHRRAIEAGVDPIALVDAMNAAQAEKAIATAELEQIPKPIKLTTSQIEKMIDALGDVRAVLDAGRPEDKQALYAAMNVQIRYDHRRQVATVTADPHGFSTGVRRGT